jgi:hypothetical protein
VIGKVTRGRQVGGLLRYLFGPGRANEHTDPHLIAAWDNIADLEPPLGSGGTRDFRRLTGLLDQPVAALSNAPAKPVWHCSLRAAPVDRRLSDAEWEFIARDVVDATGFAPRDDDEACRWVAVRHADDHIHLVVTLARQDSRRMSTSNDFFKLGNACREVEERLGLTVTAPRDRTAPKRATRGELEKAKRSRREEAPRVTLRREVSRIAGAAAREQDFLAELRSAGLLVRERYSRVNAGQLTGYAVALPGDRSKDGQPIWFGGGKLAADLSLPKLRSRWSTGRLPTQPLGNPVLTGPGRRVAWDDVTGEVGRAADDIARLAASDPSAVRAGANAASDVLANAAHLLEGRSRNHVARAALSMDRAGREPWGRVPASTPTSRALRRTAISLRRLGRANVAEGQAAAELLHGLVRLAEAVSTLREAQQRSTQAQAARAAAEQLKHAAQSQRGTTMRRHGNVPVVVRPTVVSREGLHR